MDWNHISEHITAATGRPFSGSPAGEVGGGCINRATCLRDADTGIRYFVKLNQASAAEMFASEATGMRALSDTGTIRAPTPICHGLSNHHAYLVLEWLDLSGRGDWAEMGRQLAALHQLDVGEQFGFERDNFIGATPQINTPLTNWADFFATHRLDFQIKLAQRRGARFAQGEAVQEACHRLLQDHWVQPALVHGDLWSGNASFTHQGEPVIFDGAPYRADPEVDLAMTALFGGFPAEFYSAYTDVRPMAPGWRQRRTLYNLYHILNHFNLFGGHYAGQAEHMMAQVIAAAPS